MPPPEPPSSGRSDDEGADAARRDAVTDWKGFHLLGFQIQAIEAIRAGANVLVSAPTGAGKTLIAEYAIADAVARGRRCVYTAPIKALSNQKYRDFRDDPEIDVGLMTGDVTIHPTAQVLIMTTEILRNAIFENPEGLAEVDYVILDEVHFMDDPERGSVWEEALIFAPPGIRFISLSATIANLDQLGAWMREIRPQELAVIHSDRRPVPLKHLLYTIKNGAFDVGRLDWVQKRELARPDDRKRGRGGRSDWRDRRRGRGGPRRGGGREERDLTLLFDRLQEHRELPALVFSFSRRDCERLASQNQHRQLLDEAEAERMAVLQRELIELFQLDEGEMRGEVFQLTARGVGYHHAGMLPVHKEVVERMFTSGLIKMLFTTETFALGINMPARTVVFASLRKFDGVSFDFLRTRDYMQMAGRAGRQGIDRQGLVVSFLDPRTLEDAPLRQLQQGKPEPIESRFRLSYSSLLHLLDRLGRERLHEAWEKSFNRFQHRAKNKKARDRNRKQQRALVEAHLAFLTELGYIEGEDTLTPRGKIAKLLYGYELQITEMLFRGALETLPPPALCMVFVGLIHEDRRRGPGPPPRVPHRLYGGIRRHVDGIVSRLANAEAGYGIPTPMKRPEWGLTRCVEAWCEGADIEDLEQFTEGTAGDVCRTFRMALQLMRQVRRTLDREDSLFDCLSEAVTLMNREEVDARRQLELG